MSTAIPLSDYQAIFYHGPGLRLIIAADAPDFTILDVNDAYLKATKTRRQELIGNPLFSAFATHRTEEIAQSTAQMKRCLYEALRTGEPQPMTEYRFDIPVENSTNFEAHYWNATNIPVKDADGNIRFFIHSATNITELHQLKIREQANIEAMKRQRAQLYSIFMQAPVAIGIFMGPDYTVDLINPPLSDLYGKTMEDLLGKSLFDVLGADQEPGFRSMLDQVRTTGIPYQGDGLQVPLTGQGHMGYRHSDLRYEPFRAEDGHIAGVLAVAIEVTERLKAKAMIEEAEERARLAVEAVGLGTFDLNLETDDMITSTNFAKIFGLTQPVSRAEYIKIIHPDDRFRREQAHRNAVKTGRLLYESRMIWPDRSIHWARTEGKVYYEKGKAKRILGTILDITEQKRLRTQQHKLITLVTNSVDMMSIVNLDGAISYLNQAGKTLLGVRDDLEASSIHISHLHTLEDFHWVDQSVIPTVMRAGEWAGTMNIRQLHTQEMIPVFNSMIRIDDPNTGEPIGIGAVMRDMRSEVAAKEALQKSESLLKNITTAAPTGLWQSDNHGAITYINETWIKWTGIPCEEQLGYGWLNAIIPDDQEHVRRKFTDALLHRGLYEAEFRFNHADGKIHWCVADGRPQCLPDGTCTGYIGACVDISDQKALQQQKDNFIGIASHELKTPVTSLKAYAQILEKMFERKGDFREAAMMGKMHAQLNRLANLIGDLLDVTKITTGRLQFNHQEFDFNALVLDLVEDLQRTTEKHQLIHELQPVGTVYGDKERIGQVIVNLITNAIKYSPQANEVRIYSSIQDGEVQLCVQDFGIGIASENVNRVFEQFYRVTGQVQHTFPGLGLGLYISAEIIRREGGRIWVSSEEGKGSTFCFAIPLKLQN
jgi:PAS domain S-box-containing protein